MTQDFLPQRFTELENEGFDRKTILKKLARETGLNRSEIYRAIVQAKN
jgi:DNA-binding phage protein